MSNETHNDCLWRVHAMPRSGYHAVLCWLAHLFQPRPYFLMHVRHITRPLTEYTLPAPRHVYSRWPKGVTAVEKAIKGEHRQHLFESLEGKPLFFITADDLEINTRKLGGAKTVREVLVLRDPYNWLASYFKFSLESHVQQRDWHMLIAGWRSHALEALGQTHYLNTPVVINYNRWVISKPYRREIAKGFGLKFSDEGFNIVQTVRGSSSFDKTVDAGALRKNLRQRWRGMREYGFYRQNTRFRWMARLALELFGDDDEVKAAVKESCPELAKEHK